MPHVMKPMRSWLSDQFIATCPECGAVCAYWDEEDLDEEGNLLCHCDEEDE